ncbi:MAG TPA: hypothetical protein VEU30_04195 [Thermoanaerobaculia bacterium]|nr:hypothetical protein [Thermoanaerobaculia bacterium]
MRRLLFLFASLVFCAAGSAQEIDIFDDNDFIDPRERGGVFSDQPWSMKEPGHPFYLVRLYGGAVSDYQWRTSATDADLAFLHAAGSFYRGDKQLNVKFTTFHADDQARLPSYRATLQLGQYLALDPVIATRESEGKRIVNRLLVTWAIEDNPYRSDPGVPRSDRPGEGTAEVRRDRFNHEFGIESDVQLGNVDGAFIWMRRRIEAGSYVDRISYLYRFRERLRSNDRLRLNASFGFGTERTDSWHCCLARAVFTATFVIPLIDTGFNLAWAPTYSPVGEERQTHNEFAFYLDRTVIARLRDIARR